ncbi:MAG: PorV/PorQ family protein [Candidatus Kapabacteria bacterium]|nr:PorV/PorQ family protein [Candidatus Kapabacteria bacterium]MDW8011768.1 PorV/PorQ family protein [Bacteroidota bacterium]
MYRIVLLGLFTVVPAIASSTAAFQFLRTAIAPRSAALAAATVALPEDAPSILLNPALNPTLPRRSFSSVFLKHVLDINAGALLAAGIPLMAGILSTSIVYMDYGVFERRDVQGRPLGEFSAHDIALSISYGDTLEPRLFYGLGAKLVWERLESRHAWVIAIDAGLLYRFPDERTSVGLSLLHAGTILRRFSQEPLSLPTDLRVGLTHFLQGLPAIFNLSFTRLTEPSASIWQKFENFAVGVELRFSPALRLRIGYDNALRRAAASGYRGTTGATAGVGITVPEVSVDYSATLVSAALLHRLGVQIGM